VTSLYLETYADMIHDCDRVKSIITTCSNNNDKCTLITVEIRRHCVHSFILNIPKRILVLTKELNLSYKTPI